jgi:uncharacterized tellurite resistance protein B-like protein
MRKFIQNIFGQTDSDSKDQETGIRDIQVATAALLIEVAKIDNEFSDEEHAEIVSILKSQFGISDYEVEKLLELSEKEIQKQLDLYHFTSQINENFDVDDKIKIIEMVWRVIYTDKKLDGHEDFMIHRFARLLRLDHKKLIDAKLKIKKEILSGK